MQFSILQTVLAALAVSAAVATPVKPQAKVIKVEAELGKLAGTTVKTTPAGFSGKGFVSGFATGGSVSVVVNAPKAGTFNVNLAYIAPQGAGQATLSTTSGGSSSSVGVSLQPAKKFTKANIGSIGLQAGKNTVKISGGGVGFGLDALTFTPGVAPSFPDFPDFPGV